MIVMNSFGFPSSTQIVTRRLLRWTADRTKLYVCSLHDPGMFARWVMLRHACIALPPKEFDVKKIGGG